MMGDRLGALIRSRALRVKELNLKANRLNEAGGLAVCQALGDNICRGDAR